jgi:hypothetical protein
LCLACSAAAIGEHEGLVRIEADPEVTVPEIREAVSNWYGLACPDCQRETGWDHFEWSRFFTTRKPEDE